MKRLVWRSVILFIWVAAHVLLFANKFVYIMNTPTLSTFRSIIGVTLAVSRASALVINMNSAIIIFCCCRVTLTYLRSLRIVHYLGIPLDDAMGLHKLAGYSIGLFSIVHAVGHYINLYRYSKSSGANIWVLFFVNNTGLSGHLLLLVLILLITTAAVKRIRLKKHEVFFYTHKLFLVYIVLLSVHGAFCFIKTDDPVKLCIPPQSWIWILPGFTFYMLESIYTLVRSRRFTYVSKVILHQSGIFEIQMRKPSFTFLPGQYVLLQVPSVSRLQWHPFTVTSAPEDDFISVHIRIAGDWTREVARRFGIVEGAVGLAEPPRVMPRVRIDGPYGAPCQSFSQYEVVVCIGGGIGQTPFSSVLRSIWYSVVHPTEEVPLKKLVYIGICRSVTAFEWFHDVLKALEHQDTGHFLEINYFLTGKLRPDQVHQIMHSRRDGTRDPITGLQARTFFGRPNFDPIIRELRERYFMCKVGVFYCGPPGLAKQLSKLCRKYSDASTTISFYKEHFEQ